MKHIFQIISDGYEYNADGEPCGLADEVEFRCVLCGHTETGNVHLHPTTSDGCGFTGKITLWRADEVLMQATASIIHGRPDGFDKVTEFDSSDDAVEAARRMAGHARCQLRVGDNAIAWGAQL